MEIAIIKIGRKQYLVFPGQKIKIEKLDMQEGEECTFNDVLLYKDNDGTKMGIPIIKNLRVIGKIIKQGKDKKVIVFKYKPKKRYKVKRGHRQPYTEVEIIAIDRL